VGCAGSRYTYTSVLDKAKVYLQKVILPKIIACYCFAKKASSRPNCTLYHPITLSKNNVMELLKKIVKWKVKMHH
jgi:hypothetical protein